MTNLEVIRTCDKDILMSILESIYKGKEYQNKGILEIFESRKSLSDWLGESC